jgi:hypothetical protein
MRKPANLGLEFSLYLGDCQYRPIMSHFCNFFSFPFMTSLLLACYYAYDYLKVW